MQVHATLVARRLMVTVAFVGFSVGVPWLWWVSAQAVGVWPTSWPAHEGLLRAGLLAVWGVCAVCWVWIEVSVLIELASRVTSVPGWLRRLPVATGITGLLAVAVAPHLVTGAHAAPVHSAGPAAPAPGTPSTPHIASASTPNAAGVLMHTVRAGEDLWTLAERYYGDGLGWRRIYQANVDVIRDPNLIRVGWTLQIPGVSHETEHSDDAVTSPPVMNPVPHRPGAGLASTVDPTPTPTPMADPTSTPTSQAPTSAVQASSAPMDTTASQPAEPRAVPTLASSDVAGLAGVAGLLAATLVAGLGVHRRRQLARTDAGQQPVPDERLERLERALRRAATPRLHEVVDIVQTVISRHCRGGCLPPLAHLRVDADRVDISWGPVPDGELLGPPPAGWEVTEHGWAIDVESLPVDVEPAPRAFPSLATWARTASGADCVELSDLGSVGVCGVRRADVVRALAASLFTGDGAHARVICVGLPEWDALGDPNFEVADSLEAAVSVATAPRAATRAERLDPNLAAEVVPVVIISANDPSDDEAASLEAAARRGVTVVCAGFEAGRWQFDVDAGTWTCDAEESVPSVRGDAVPAYAHLRRLLDQLPGTAVSAVDVPALSSTSSTARGDIVDRLRGISLPAEPGVSSDATGPLSATSDLGLHTDEPGVTFDVHPNVEPALDHSGVRSDVEPALDQPGATSAASLCALDAAMGEVLDRLFRHTQSADTTASPWWDHPTSLDPENDVSPSPGPHLDLLGPIELHAVRGTEPTRAKRQCLEYAAWLLDNPGSTASTMASALSVAESTRRSNMSRLRTWLGRDDDGVAYLPEAYSGRISLHPDVTSDWQRFCWLTGSAVATLDFDRARLALDLVRGKPLQDAAPGLWFWAEVLRTEMTLRIRDVACVAATDALRHRRYDDARWACARGMLVAPEDELLTCIRIDVEVRAGDHVEAERLISRLIHQAKVLEVDLSPTAEACIEEASRKLSALASAR